MTSLKPLLLHAHPTAPNPIKVAIALELLQIPYNVKIWEFNDNNRKGVKGSDFVKINPNGRVPALEDPNTNVTSWESGAILNYLKRQYDTDNLLGPVDNSEQARADLEAWEYLLVTTLGPFTGQVVWFKYYHQPTNDDAAARYIKQVHRVYGVVETQLMKSGGDTILPGKFTTADIHYIPWMRSSAYIGLPLDDYPLLERWTKIMFNKPEVKQALQRIQDATAEQEPEAAVRGLKPDLNLMRQTGAQEVY
ncbi:uncharacterized protein A1O9_11496 [Exophiala aquamarina CBS 119918]|uniref:Glutathione S-transferase n=1 Tax=Exophiala aquamarina CBS 119918 TaxID=1182545 RepID=A0A072NXG7_9EURO|nr:uncharacterized protein A1O9_11496 [Exophiala aquamarina CBS 119918]KEF52256.1 hypothetical protein A1O9_11496 [Exophiala aquamarina CBS 119918]